MKRLTIDRRSVLTGLGATSAALAFATGSQSGGIVIGYSVVTDLAWFLRQSS